MPVMSVCGDVFLMCVSAGAEANIKSIRTNSLLTRFNIYAVEHIFNCSRKQQG